MSETNWNRRSHGRETWTCVIVNDDQQDAIIIVYLFIPSQLYMFRAMSLPIIRSTWLYLQFLILSTYFAADSWWWANTSLETCRAD